MFSRFKETLTSKANWLKRGIIACANAIPGLALVASKSGSAVFNGFKFTDYLARLFNNSDIGSKSPIGIIFSTIGMSAALITTFYTRFFNMYHTESKKKSIPQSTMLLKENLLSQVPPRKETCCYPGVDTDSYDVGYKLSQIINGIYGFGSASSGILSMNSLVNLFMLWTQSNYDSKCDKNESDPYKIALVNFANAILIYAIVLSYIKYNIPALREYYRKLIIEKGWRDLSYWKLFEVLMASALSAVGVWYSNHAISEIVSDEMLCHLSSQENLQIPDMVTKLIAGVGASSTFINIALLTAGAKQSKQNQAHEAKENTTNEYGWMNKPLDIAILGNALNIGFSTYNATADLPNTLAHRMDLTTHPVTICIAFCAFIIAARNQYALDYESKLREAKRRRRVAAINEIEENKYDPTIFGSSSTNKLSPTHLASTTCVVPDIEQARSFEKGG